MSGGKCLISNGRIRVQPFLKEEQRSQMIGPSLAEGDPDRIH